jgi:N-acetylmuramic acid 6-phosphate etherase
VGAIATNAKLRGRIAAALVAATGEELEACRDAVEAANGDGRVALLVLLSGVSAPIAERALESTNGHVRDALEALSRR